MHIKTKYELDLKNVQQIADSLKADAVAFQLLSQDTNKRVPNSRKTKPTISQSKGTDIQDRLNKRISDQDLEIESLKAQLRKANAELSQKQSVINQMGIEFQRYQVIKSFESRSHEDQSDDYHNHRILRNRLAHSTNVVCI